MGQLAIHPSARAYKGTRSVGKAVNLDWLCLVDAHTFGPPWF